MNSSEHIPATALRQYVAGDTAVAADTLWAIEAHLESCAPCRARLGETVTRHSPETVSLLAGVQADLATALARSTQMPTRRLPRRVGRWAPPGLWPRLAMTLLVLAAALGLDLADGAGVMPSLVLLVAPVAPLLGVAAVWSAGLDPAHELVVASPRAGLFMVLRRTLAVLVVVVPALGVAGWLTAASPAAWLLPCLAFTAGALALGELIGLRWAAAVLGLAWTAVIAPSLLALRIPLLLQPVSLPYWAGLIAIIAVVLVVRRDAYTGLRSNPWFVR
jgi:hypothetical protein